MEVEVTHKGEAYKVRLDRNALTVADVRREMRNRHRVDLAALTAEARMLDDPNHLVRDLGFDTGSVARLVGAVRLRVKDPDCRVESVVEVVASDAIDDVLKKYTDALHRVKHEGAQLLFENVPQLDETTVHDCGLRDGDTLEFVSPRFLVRVQTVEAGHIEPTSAEIEVRDHFTVGEVRDQFMSMTSLALDADALVTRGTDVLDLGTALYRYGVRDGALLNIASEDDAQVHHYQCADCGDDVKLKKTDIVQCRRCGYRIVYKRRTMDPGQYLAR